MRKLFSIIAAAAVSFAAPAQPHHELVKIIFDTDIGNDVDDVLALSVLHALQSRGDVELLAVTVTKPDDLAGPFVSAVNTFYGRPNIPIGCVRPKTDEELSRYLPLAIEKDDGNWRYPHALKHGYDAPEPAQLLRELLMKQPDHSVVIVQVGYFSNLASLLGTTNDKTSALTGSELVALKVKFLSVMAGSFQANDSNPHRLEFNVVKDLVAAQTVIKGWPTPIVWSGFEIGNAVPYPAKSIEHDFSYVPHHPAAEAYYRYLPPPHERPCWDLTSVLYAAFPDRDYFGASAPGHVTMEADGFVRFKPEANGRDRYLTLNGNQIIRVREALVQLASQPPNPPCK